MVHGVTIEQVILGLFVLLLGAASIVAWSLWLTGVVPPRFWARAPRAADIPWTGLDALLYFLLGIGNDLFILIISLRLKSAGRFVGALLQTLDPSFAAYAAAQELPGGKADINDMVLISAARLVWLLLGVGLFCGLRKARASDLGFAPLAPLRDTILGGLLFLLAILPMYGLNAILTQFFEPSHPLIKQTEANPSLWTFAAATFAAVIVAPLFEEFLFRVILQGWLEQADINRQRRLGVESPVAGWWPIVVSSMIFALMHAGQGPAPFPLFIFALFLGYAYRQTHRIYPSLLMHAANNSLALVGLWVQTHAG